MLKSLDFLLHRPLFQGQSLGIQFSEGLFDLALLIPQAVLAALGLGEVVLFEIGPAQAVYLPPRQGVIAIIVIAGN